MTDFHAMCAELYGIFEKYDDASNLAGIYWDMEKEGNDILDRARAALAEPEPEKPTDEDLLNLHDWMTDEWAANHDFELPPSQYARAVLARFGK